MIKAIETVYKGYRFRSRLEARWAVFFDEMGIEYQYELEGFETPFGWYLPDFYLPKMHAWVEVKGGRELTTKERRQFKWVCANTYSLGLVVMGDPVDCGLNTVGSTLAFFSEPYGNGDTEKYCSMQDRFLFLPNNNGIATYHECSDGFYHYFCDYDYDELAKEFINLTGKLDPPGAIRGPLGAGVMAYFKTNGKGREFVNIYDKCAKKARQARFEHGEKPNGVHP